MGNENSTPNFRAIAQMRREQLQRQHQQKYVISDAIERKDRHRSAADKELASTIREERRRYMTPLSHVLVNKETGKLNPFPPAEYPCSSSSSSSSSSSLSASRLPAQWTAAWVALLVRSGAIAPFEECPADEDPLSTSAFVAFMLDTVQQTKKQQQQQQQQQKDEDEMNKLSQPASGNNSFGNKEDLLAPPPPREIPGEDSWIIVESSAPAAASPLNTAPFVPASAPWPMEECGVCLCFFNNGINCCAGCGGGVCSSCLLNIVKPPVFDVSNDESIKRCFLRKKELVEELSKIIKTFEKQRSPPPELISLEELSKSVSGAIEKVSEVGQSISSFFQQKKQSPPLGPSPPPAAAAAAGAASSSKSPNLSASSPPQQSVTSAPAAASGDAELRMAKQLLELVTRTEVLGLFDCAPTTSSSSSRSRSNSLGMNHHHHDDDDDDDGENGVSSSRTSRAVLAVTPHGCDPHEWPVPDSLSYDDLSSDATSFLDQCCAAIHRSIRIQSRGRCPFCNASPTAWIYSGRKSRMVILKELADLAGCDRRVLDVFSARSAAASGDSPPQRQDSESSGINGEGRVWIAPTETETSEYELCVALALSAVVDSQLEDIPDVDGARERFLDTSVRWAERCSCCKSVNWSEHKCRVCQRKRR